tara:strand:- start:5496 stop:5708 length:213 start_codon:yes stop_codon:yes gene_type:complete
LAFAVKNGTRDVSLISALQKFHLVYSIGIQPSEVDKMSASEVIEFMKMTDIVNKSKSMSGKSKRELGKLL